MLLKNNNLVSFDLNLYKSRSRQIDICFDKTFGTFSFFISPEMETLINIYFPY